jgi:hypothetical protein
MSLEEVVVGHRNDADFGALDYVETRTRAAVDGGPMKPLIFRSWQGKCPQLSAGILISSENDPPEITEDDRLAYRGVLADPEAFKKDVARRQLELARDWAASGGIRSDFDETALAAMLRIDAFTVDPGRLTVWLENTEDIFAGHAIEVRIENGAITEIVLAG